MGEVKVVVRVWAMASPPPNSFFCCYGYYKEKNERINYDTILNTVTFNQLCQGKTHTICNLQMLIVCLGSTTISLLISLLMHTHIHPRFKKPACKHKNTEACPVWYF